VECIESIEIPGSVTEFEEYMFDVCTKLQYIHVAEDNPLYASVDGVLYNKDKTELIFVPKGVESFTIPTSVIRIAEGAFEACRNLTSITIPSSVTSIGDSAFSNCINLINVDLSSNLISIGNQAFADCGLLTDLKIPSSVTSIGNQAFANCSSLSVMKIPSSVTSIGERAFFNCYGLSEFQVDADNQNFTTIDGVLFSKDLTKIIAVHGKLTEYEVPYGVTSIADYQFYRYPSTLKSVIIPSSVTRIGSYAFFGCNSLKSIYIPSSVVRFGKTAFLDCWDARITIDNSVDNIVDEGGAFYESGYVEWLR
jgi:hypothetical protein